MTTDNGMIKSGSFSFCFSFTELQLETVSKAFHITACIVILISVGIIYSIEKIKERKTFKSKNIVGQRVKYFKNKTCTLIKWK